MPCRDDVPHYTAEEQEIFDLRDRLNRATQLLCYICGSNVEFFNKEDVSQSPRLSKFFREEPRIRRWWKGHYRQDTARVSEEFSRLWENWISYNNVTLENLDPDEVEKQKRKMVKRAIEDAEREHPLSEFHKKWFARVSTEALKKSIKDFILAADKARRRQALLNSLTKEERDLLKSGKD